MCLCNFSESERKERKIGDLCHVFRFYYFLIIFFVCVSLGLHCATAVAQKGQEVKKLKSKNKKSTFSIYLFPFCATLVGLLCNQSVLNSTISCTKRRRVSFGPFCATILQPDIYSISWWSIVYIYIHILRIHEVSSETAVKRNIIPVYTRTETTIPAFSYCLYRFTFISLCVCPPSLVRVNHKK